MAVTFNKLVTPASNDYKNVADHSKVAIGVAVIGLMLAMVVAGISLAAANDVGSGGGDAAQLLAIGFGLQTLALVTIKISIAIALIGILVRLWLRIDSVKVALAALRPSDNGNGPSVGDIETDYGAATVTATARNGHRDSPRSPTDPQDGSHNVVSDDRYGSNARCSGCCDIVRLVQQHWYQDRSWSLGMDTGTSVPRRGPCPCGHLVPARLDPRVSARRRRRCSADIGVEHHDTQDASDGEGIRCTHGNGADDLDGAIRSVSLHADLRHSGRGCRLVGMAWTAP